MASGPLGKSLYACFQAAYVLSVSPHWCISLFNTLALVGIGDVGVPQTGVSGRLQSMELKRVGHHLATKQQMADIYCALTVC